MGNRQKVDLKDSDVLPILRQEFIEGTSFPADVFLRMARDRYVLVARQGDKANLIEMHLSEDIKQLHVRRTDYKNLVGQSLSIAGILINKEELSSEKKAAFISKAAESVFTELEQLGISHDAIEHTRSIANNVKTLVESKSDLLQLMTILASLPNGNMRHAMSVSAISVIIAKKLGWSVPATLEKLAMGALLIDVGHKEIPKEIVEKPRHLLTYDERVIYETHPFRGAEILRSMPSISDEIIAMVYEHHENAIGQGYPRRLRDLRMNPLAKVVCAAETFCDLTMKSVNTATPRAPKEAIDYIETTMGQPFNKQVFNALKSLIYFQQAAA